MSSVAATAVPLNVSPAAPAVSVDTISDYRTFLDLEPLWNRLVEEAGIEHPFLTHEWARTWWESFGAGKDLHILVANAGRVPIALAPLMLSQERLYGVKVRRLGFMANVHTPRADFIVARRPADAYRAMWQTLVDEHTRWDMLELCQVPAGSRTLEELSRLAAEGGFLSGRWQAGDSPYLRLRGSWESYVGSLDRKHRANLRNRLKRLNGLGEVKLEVIGAGEPVAPALEEGLQIEAAAWKGKAGTAIRCRPELSQFYAALARGAAERGELRLQFLTVGDRRIAFGYSLCRKNRLYLLKPGYHPQYAPYSPSNLLCALVLRDAYARGVAEFDFLGTADDWKLEWTRTTRSHEWLYVFPDTWRMCLLHQAKFRLVPWLKRRRLYVMLRDAVLKPWRPAACHGAVKGLN